MLSLYTSLNKFNQRRERESSTRNSRILLAQSQNHLSTSLTDDIVTTDVMTSGHRNSLRLIPIEVVNAPLIASLLNHANSGGEITLNESATGKFYILHV